MKDFSPQIEGPPGPWYQKVNAAVQQAREAKTPDQLRAILGEPDIIEILSDDDRRVSRNSPVDERYPAEYWIYIDPYRPRFRYLFGISAGWIVERSRSTGP